MRDFINDIKSGLGRIRLAQKYMISESAARRVINFFRKHGEEETLQKELADFTNTGRKVSNTAKSMYKEHQLKKKIKQKDKAIRSLTKELEETHIRNDIAEGLTKDDFRVSELVETKSNNIPVIVASDWHIEERIDSYTVSSMNEFNLEIAKERASTFFSRVVEHINSLTPDSDTAVLALLGDMISGYIHEELLESNECSPTQAISLLNGIIISGIDYILDNTKITNLVIPCCCGNHGRTTQRKRISTQVENSFEWLLYDFLDKHYKNHPKVNFKIAKGYHNYLRLFNKWVIRFHHGDSMRYNGGVGGIYIPVNKAISQWNKARHAHYDVFGHFHQFKDGSNWLSNGCLVGYSPFALSIKADYERPRQIFFVLNEEDGKTITAPIYVD